jgi:hypothetical protein
MVVHKNVTLCTSTDCDWIGLYLDGQLWTEKHSLSNSDWIELITYHYIESVTQYEVDNEWLEDQGGTFPEQLNDIPKSALS